MLGDMNLFKKWGKKILLNGESANIGNVAPATKNGEVVVYEQLYTSSNRAYNIWQKHTKTYLNFQPNAGLVGAVNLTVASGYIVTHVVMYVSQAFNGGVDDLNYITCGNATTTCGTLASAGITTWGAGSTSKDISTDYPFSLTLNMDSLAINTLTQGSIDVYLKLEAFQ